MKPNNNTNTNNNHSMHVPAGRSLSDMPKAEPKPAPTGAAQRPNTQCTFRQLLTDNGAKEHLVEFFKSLGQKKGKGKAAWAPRWQFFIDNMSGDYTAMSPENKKKCEEIVKAVNDSYFESELE
jgi:hypothetical protein